MRRSGAPFSCGRTLGTLVVFCSTFMPAVRRGPAITSAGRHFGPTGAALRFVGTWGCSGRGRCHRRGRGRGLRGARAQGGRALQRGSKAQEVGYGREPAAAGRRLIARARIHRRDVVCRLLAPDFDFTSSPCCACPARDGQDHTWPGRCITRLPLKDAVEHRDLRPTPCCPEGVDVILSAGFTKDHSLLSNGIGRRLPAVKDNVKIFRAFQPYAELNEKVARTAAWQPTGDRPPPHRHHQRRVLGLQVPRHGGHRNLDLRALRARQRRRQGVLVQSGQRLRAGGLWPARAAVQVVPTIEATV